MPKPYRKEDFYDQEIAPAVAEIGKKCEAAGISFVAFTEWEPGETGTTATIQNDAGFGLRLVHLAAQCHGNVDALFMAIIKHAREHGHSSLYLNKLGVAVK